MADTYIEDLKRRLRLIEDKMDRARGRAEAGDLHDKVTAEGDLAELDLRRKEVVERIADAEKRDAEDWSPEHKRLHEDVDDLGNALERWATRYLRERGL